jgi:hypothetical protein
VLQALTLITSCQSPWVLITKRICKARVTPAILGKRQHKTQTLHTKQKPVVKARKTENVMPFLPYLAILISLFGLLVTGGAVSFFIKYGTRLAMVERESTDNRAKLEKHATDLIQANQQVALVAAALENIKTTLTEIKSDVKQWMREHSASHPSE